jgi:biopolymer transport protein ExbB/TolQ
MSQNLNESAVVLVKSLINFLKALKENASVLEAFNEKIHVEDLNRLLTVYYKEGFALEGDVDEMRHEHEDLVGVVKEIKLNQTEMKRAIEELQAAFGIALNEELGQVFKTLKKLQQAFEGKDEDF